jgi:hypothetical protein
MFISLHTSQNIVEKFETKKELHEWCNSFQIIFLLLSDIRENLLNIIVVFNFV